MADSAWALTQLLAGGRVTCGPLGDGWVELREGVLVGPAEGRRGGKMIGTLELHILRTDWAAAPAAGVDFTTAHAKMAAGQSVRRSAMQAGTHRAIRGRAFVTLTDGSDVVTAWNPSLADIEAVDWVESTVIPPDPQP